MVINEVIDDKDLVVEIKMVKIELMSFVEKIVSMENNIKFIVKDVEGVLWEIEEVIKVVFFVSNFFVVVFDGLFLFCSLRSEEGGSGIGSFFWL